MTPDEREQMTILCERIATEKDPNRFMALVGQLNKLLERKQSRFAQEDSLTEKYLTEK